MSNKQEKKDYAPINLSENKRYASLEEHTRTHYSDAGMVELKRRNARFSCAHALTTMRIKSGISQVVMAGAIGCQQPRISLIESSPNEKISMATILKYVDITKQPFSAELEDGKVIKVSSQRPSKPKKTIAA